MSAILRVKDENGNIIEIPAIQGEPGVSISNIECEQSTEDGGDNIVNISMTNGESFSFNVINGSKGDDGVSATHAWDGTTLTMTSASGTSSADLKGEAGTSVTIDNVSESSESGGSNVVTFSSGETLTVKNGEQGEAGYTPVKGTDYYTDAEKQEIIDAVIAYFGGQPITGYVDENNVIVLNGALAEGTYTIKYEMDSGETVEIGDLVLDNNTYYSVTNTLTNCTNSNSDTQAVGGSGYTATISANSGFELSSVTVTMGGTDITDSAVSGGNISIESVTGDIVITAVAEEVTSGYTNILTSGDYDIKLDQRWSNSNGGFTTCTGMISFVIPIADVANKTIYFKGFTKGIKASNAAPIWFTIKDNVRHCNLFSSDTTGNVWLADSLITVDESIGIYGIKVDTTNFTSVSSDSVDGLVINMSVYESASVGTAVPSGLIMTIDEEITD